MSAKPDVPVLLLLNTELARHSHPSLGRRNTPKTQCQRPWITFTAPALNSEGSLWVTFCPQIRWAGWVKSFFIPCAVRLP